MRRNSLLALVLPLAWALAPGCRCQGEPLSQSAGQSAAGAGPRFVGRFVPEADGAMRFAWSGSSISARFEGTYLAVNMEDVQNPNGPASTDPNTVWGNIYDVIVDDHPPLVVPMLPHDTHHVIAQSLPPGEHQVTVIKRTEALLGESIFRSFDLGKEGRLLPPPAPRQRRIEIIGDSISAGYGDEGNNEKCKFSPQTENVDLAYGPMTARALNADVTVLAWSGKGVLRNLDGSKADTMSRLVERSLPERPDSTWDFARWQPDAVVVNLGTNDFNPATPLPDGTDFTEAYSAFLRSVRQRYPEAFIVCAIGPMLSDEFPKGKNILSTARSAINQAVNSVQDKRIAILEFPTQTGHRGYGCDWHPSLATHAAMAAELTAFLRQKLDW